MRDLGSNTYKRRLRGFGDEHYLLIRRPTCEEHAAYGASLIQRRGGNILMRAIQTRIKFGAKLLVGFSKGTFGLNGKAIASDPQDPDYYPDWKELLVKEAPDIVADVARDAFEGTKVVTDDGSSLDEDIDALLGEFDDEVPATEDPSTSSER